MAKNFSESDAGNMSNYDPTLGMRHKPKLPKGTGFGKKALSPGGRPKSKGPDAVQKPGITKGAQKVPKAKQLKSIKNKYPGRFSRGAKPTPSPKHGFAPPGTTKVGKKMNPGY